VQHGRSKWLIGRSEPLWRSKWLLKHASVLYIMRHGNTATRMIVGMLKWVAKWASWIAGTAVNANHLLLQHALLMLTAKVQS